MKAQILVILCFVSLIFLSCATTQHVTVTGEVVSSTPVTDASSKLSDEQTESAVIAEKIVDTGTQAEDALTDATVLVQKDSSKEDVLASLSKANDHIVTLQKLANTQRDNLQNERNSKKALDTEFMSYKDKQEELNTKLTKEKNELQQALSSLQLQIEKVKHRAAILLLVCILLCLAIAAYIVGKIKKLL